MGKKKPSFGEAHDCKAKVYKALSSKHWAALKTVYELWERGIGTIIYLTMVSVKKKNQTNSMYELTMVELIIPDLE